MLGRVRGVEGEGMVLPAFYWTEKGKVIVMAGSDVGRSAEGVWASVGGLRVESHTSRPRWKTL